MGRKAFSRNLAESNGLAGDRFSATDEEAQRAQEVLVSDLQNLSLDDQEKLAFEIHGLEPNGVDDNNIRLNRALDALEKELEGIWSEKKSAYEQALYLNPEYVRGPMLRRAFLECSNYDPVLAADQIVQHFATKKSLFGNGSVLGREILLSDLSDKDMEYLENSSVQILPSRDAAGRVVMFCAPGCGESGLSDSVVRVAWYFQQALLREEGVMENGYVHVNYNMGKYGRIIELEDMEKIANKLVDGCCTKMVVEHFCYDDPKMDNWVAGSAVFSDESFRHRLRCHFGSESEVLFKLQTFGIPTHDFPINDEQTLDLTWHRQWLQLQRKREAAMHPALLVVPRRFDVLFGRGSDTRVHTGNLRAKHLVEMRFEEYNAAKKEGKTLIAEEIVAAIKKSHGRFLKWGDDEGWIEVDDDCSRNKITHFFRRRRIAQMNAVENVTSK